MSNYKYTKEDIKNVAHEIMKMLLNCGLAGDSCVYFNGERWSNDYSNLWRQDTDEAEYHSQNYSHYAPDDQIVVITSEGPLYEYLEHYGELPKSISETYEKYDLYLEHITSWMYALVPVGDWDEWEVYKNPTLYRDPTYLYNAEVCPDEIILAIREYWRACIAAGKDEGPCVIGASMEFTYNGVNYQMTPPSIYQGSVSWERHVDIVKQMLEHVGATNIYYNPGQLD